MSLSCRDIINRAYRKLGSLEPGVDAEAEEMADGFIALNSMCRVLAGTVIGPRLSPQPMTTNLQAENGGFYQCALTSAATITAPANPKSGARFGLADAAACFAVNPLTINPNGRLLENSTTPPALATNGLSRIWFFDADTANWIREADLASVGVSPPYPDRLIDFMPDMLAVFMASEVEKDALGDDVVSLSSSGIQAFARTYGRRGRNQIDPPAGFSLKAA